MTKSNIGPAGRSFRSTFKMNPQLLEFEEVQGRLFKRSRDRWEERKGGKRGAESSQRQEPPPRQSTLTGLTRVFRGEEFLS